MHDDGRRFASKHSCCHGETFSNLQRVPHLHNLYQRDSDLCNNPIYKYVLSPIIDTAVATVRHFQIYRGSPICTISINAILTYATIPYMKIVDAQLLPLWNIFKFTERPRLARFLLMRFPLMQQSHLWICVLANRQRNSTRVVSLE